MKGQNESFCSEKLKINQIGFLVTHKNGDFGAISVTERSWARRSLRLSVFTLYRILFIIALHRHENQTGYTVGLPITHEKGDFGAILVTGRSCAAPIS